MNYNCPLCDGSSTFFNSAVKPFEANYSRCNQCDLVFMDPTYLLDSSEEKERYLTHNNDINDERYVDFLNKLILPVQKYITKEMKGLDYGSGPSPVLAQLMLRSGYQIEAYDPYFSKIDLGEEYDFITSSEVVEHFYNPKVEFDNLIARLKVGGILGVMTSILYQDIDFEKWYYRHDNTHVSFYTPKSLQYLQDHYKLKQLHLSENIVIWKKL
jgi:hypothetical protein